MRGAGRSWTGSAERTGPAIVGLRQLETPVPEGMEQRVQRYEADSNGVLVESEEEVPFSSLHSGFSWMQSGEPVWSDVLCTAGLLKSHTGPDLAPEDNGRVRNSCACVICAAVAGIGPSKGARHCRHGPQGPGEEVSWHDALQECAH